MKKMNRKGFTLVEMILVVAIIVILGGVLISGASQMLPSLKSKVEGVGAARDAELRVLEDGYAGDYVGYSSYTPNAATAEENAMSAENTESAEDLVSVEDTMSGPPTEVAINTMISYTASTDTYRTVRAASNFNSAQTLTADQQALVRNIQEQMGTNDVFVQGYYVKEPGTDRSGNRLLRVTTDGSNFTWAETTSRVSNVQIVEFEYNSRGELIRASECTATVNRTNNNESAGCKFDNIVVTNELDVNDYR